MLLDAQLRAAQLRDMVTPLRLIFWGGLLVLLDISFSFTTNGRGYRLDVLNDFVGMILIATGVFQLGRFELTISYAKAMNFVKAVCIIATLEALMAQTVFPRPAAWQWIDSAFGLAKLGAMVVFCFTMRLLCLASLLKGPAGSWRITSLLFVVLYAIPFGFIQAASLVLTTGFAAPFSFDLGPVGLLFLPMCVAPLIHFFISTSRMAQAAKSASIGWV